MRDETDATSGESGIGTFAQVSAAFRARTMPEAMVDITHRGQWPSRVHWTEGLLVRAQSWSASTPPTCRQGGSHGAAGVPGLFVGPAFDTIPASSSLHLKPRVGREFP